MSSAAYVRVLGVQVNTNERCEPMWMSRQYLSCPCDWCNEKFCMICDEEFTPHPWRDYAGREIHGSGAVVLCPKCEEQEQ